MKQLKDKKEECFNNLLNSINSGLITSDNDIELEEEVKSSDLIRHILPQQAQTVGEIAHLVKHDALDIQKQETESEVEKVEEN